MRYLVKSVSKSPFAVPITLAVGAVADAVGEYQLLQYVTRLNLLLRSLQKTCGVTSVKDLTKDMWVNYATITEMTPGRYDNLRAYHAITNGHLPEYLEQLAPNLRNRVEQHILPRLPRNYMEQYGGGEAVREAARRRRKEQTSIVAPLHHVLVALVHYRYQAMKRLLQAFREARDRAEKLDANALPITFSYEDELVTINRDAQTVAEIRLKKRPITMRFLLWDRRNWVVKHKDDYGKTTWQDAKHGYAGYASSEERFFFVQFLGSTEELLWFGNLVKYRLLQKTPLQMQPDDEQQRKALLTEIGRTEGLNCSRPNVLSLSQTRSVVLSHAIFRTGALLFDPEALNLGALYGAALAMLSLTNGSRVSELLQISADRFKVHTYDEKKHGQLTGEQKVIRLQHLLPKGKKTEAERQLFLISEGSYALLREIAQGLKEAHEGRIPTVNPHYNHTKRGDLSSERYLFQWGAEFDGRFGAFAPYDVNDLLVFILYGLEFRTKQGEPFTVSTHLLRHVMATVARHEHDLPVEAVAYALHHRHQTESSNHATVSAATEYYSEEPEERSLLAFAEFQTDLEEWSASLEVGVPDEHKLEEMDDDLRDVFERWHTLLETTFGFCGRTELCPRGYNRTLCIGCPHLVADHRKRPTAVKWRSVYTKQAEELEENGNTVDARQNRLLVRELDDLINSMNVMAQALEYGHTPLFLQLPSVPYDEIFRNE